MINKICKTSGFKLPHTSTSPVLTKQTEEVQPEININFPRLENRMPAGEGKYDTSAIRLNGDDKPPFAPKNDDKVPSFDATFKNNNEDVVSSSGGDNTIDYSNMTPEQKSSLEDFWKTEIENYGGIEPGSEGYNELVGANRYAVYDRGRFRPDGQGGGTYQFDKPQWRLKGGGPEYDNPKGIHPDQLMRMYQGDNNKYE